jgi:DMSO/TMAO reductase YedYZ heme-binding membrane subunit
MDKCYIEYDQGGRRKSRPSTEAGEPGDYVFAACTPMWFFWRTLLQGFGELFLEEMTNYISFIVLIFTFIVLNVVLLNLLIAIMSGT